MKRLISLQQRLAKFFPLKFRHGRNHKRSVMLGDPRVKSKNPEDEFESFILVHNYKKPDTSKIESPKKRTAGFIGILSGDTLNFYPIAGFLEIEKPTDNATNLVSFVDYVKNKYNQ